MIGILLGEYSSVLVCARPHRRVLKSKASIHIRLPKERMATQSKQSLKTKLTKMGVAHAYITHVAAIV